MVIAVCCRDNLPHKPSHANAGDGHIRVAFRAVVAKHDMQALLIEIQ
jgi:hypothetical protein